MKNQSKRQRGKRQIIGLSLSPDLAAEVKREAASRGVALKTLFEELWDLYRQKQKKAA